MPSKKEIASKKSLGNKLNIMLALNYFKSVNKQIIYVFMDFLNPKLLLTSYKQFNSTQNHFLNKKIKKKKKTHHKTKFNWCLGLMINNIH